MVQKTVSDGRTHEDVETLVSAHPREWEHVTSISASPLVDHTVTINGGVAYGVYCDTEGEILKIDNQTQAGYTTLALQAGFNPMEITKIYAVGTTITGNIDVYAW